VERIDPYAPEALADPGKFYGDLAGRCPIAHVEDPGFFILSGYDQVKGILGDHETWSKAHGDLLERDTPNLALSQDPPDFLDFRRVYRDYMSHKGVRRWAGRMTEIATELFDAMEPLGSGDLQDLIGKPLAVRVMCVVLGMPYRDFDQYREWSDAFLLAVASEPGTTARAIQALYDFFDTQIAVRRIMLADAGVDTAGQEHIGPVLPDDLMSTMMTARFQGRPLNDDELRRTMRGFFVGGIDTTGALILHVLHRLLEDRSRWDRVVADPGLVPAAMEEALRFDSPVVGMFREATCPIRVDGVDIPASSRAMFSLAGANRDPSQFQDPNSFRLDRSPSERSKHMAFGFGAHFCPGAWVARQEAGIALDLIVRRFPKLRPTGAVVRSEPFNFYEWMRFPAAWD
jgi:cytochrome P450